MDLTESIIPRSDQLNADDLISGPRTVTIADVTAGTDEQPVNIITAEFGPSRPYKPSKSMRRILVAAWGPEASTYTGRRITIYRDPEIMFGRDKVGGIRISHLSHIDKRLTLALTVTRGKRAAFVVEPLPEGKPALTSADVDNFENLIAAADTIDQLDAVAAELKAWDLVGNRAHLQAIWAARHAELLEAATPEAVSHE